MSIQILRGPASTIGNPILEEGQLYLVNDTTPNKLKVGDGQTNLNSLPYIGAEFASDVYRNDGIYPTRTPFTIATADIPVFSLDTKQIHVDTIYSESQDSISLMNSILPTDITVNLGDAGTRFNYIYGENIYGTDVYCSRIHLRTGLLEYQGGSAGHVGSNLSIEKHELVDYDSLARSVLGSYTRSVVTASRVLVSDSSGKLSASSITSTELGYLDGVTSNVQTQLNGKAASSHSHSYLPLSGGTITGDLTVNSSLTCNYRITVAGTKYPHFYASDATCTIGKDASNQLCIQGGTIRPGGNGHQNLGNGAHRWATIYAVTGSINTSDKNEKKDIQELDEQYSKDIIMGLKPVSYKFIKNDSNRTHNGFIAQDIEELLANLGLTTQDFAAVCKWQKVHCEDGVNETPIEGEYSYGLRYEELIAPLVKVVQFQQQEIDTLKTQLNLITEE